MKFKYLGTAAAEGFPAVFCDCEYCKEARKRKGKNIRTRSQAIINEDLLIDLPADTYMHALNGDLEMFKVKYLLLTHEHGDHFYPQELNVRGHWFAPNLKQKLIIIGSKVVYEKYLKFTDTMSQGVRDLIEFRVVNAFDKFTLGDYEIVALPARHGSMTGFIYDIQTKNKRILYGHDTGYFLDSVLNWIKDNGVKYDFVSFDCTNVDLLIEDCGSHMGLENISRLKKVMESFGAINKSTILYVNHFSHNANPLHEELCEKAENRGLKVSYDGLELDL
jgi:phosphoribosyl 1,2-cyclic phosphate phosphodiesterase